MSLENNTIELQAILAAVNALPEADGSGGIVPTGTRQITENGTYDVTGYANAEVDVPVPDGYIMPSGTKEVTANGEHNVTEYASVVVSVPERVPVVESLTVTENGTFEAPEGVDGYSKVTVDVPQSGSSVETCTLELHPINDAFVETVAYVAVSADGELEYRGVTHGTVEALTISDCACGSVVSIQYNYGVNALTFTNCEVLQNISSTGYKVFTVLNIGITAEAGGTVTISGRTTGVSS